MCIYVIVKGGILLNVNGKIIVKDVDEVVFFVIVDIDYKINFDLDFKDFKVYVGVNFVEIIC